MGQQPRFSMPYPGGIWPTALAAIAILLGATAWSLQAEYQSRIRESSIFRDALARIAADRLSSRFKEIDRDISTIIHLIRGHGIERVAPGGIDELMPLLKDALWFAFTDRRGVVVTTTEPAFTGTDLAGASYIRFHQDNPSEGIFLSEPMNADGQRSVLVASKGIAAGGGEPEGVAAMALDASALANDLISAMPWNGGSIVLFGVDYVIRLRIPEPGVFQATSLKGMPVTESFLSSGATTAEHRVVSPFDGQDRFVTLRSISPPTRLMLAVSQTAESVLAPWKKRAMYQGSLTLLGSILILSLAFVGNRAEASARRADSARQRQDALLSSLFENLPVDVCARDLSGRILFQSKTCQGACSALSESPYDMASDPDAVIGLWAERFTTAIRGDATRVQETIARPQGKSRLIENYFGPIMENGSVIGTLGVNYDITELKRAEEHLRQALAEKEIMLREIHHRVKNNLQIVLSLINLECAMNGEDAGGGLQRTCSRIRGMALIHEQLYGSINLAVLPVAGYIASLADLVAKTHRGCSSAPDVKLDVCDITISLDRAVPLGLILNELLTNAYKHAFGNCRKGLLEVSVKETGSGGAVLTIQDDGPGLPGDFSINNCGTLGMQLITSLAAQIGGRVEAMNRDGARFEVSFHLGDTIREEPPHS